MTETNNPIDQFSKHLFWDVDRSEIDVDKHAKTIVANVLMYGTYEDWKKMVRLYGIPRIAEVAQKLRHLDKKSAAFVATLGKLPLETFRCFSDTQSTNELWTS